MPMMTLRHAAAEPARYRAVSPSLRHALLDSAWHNDFAGEVAGEQ